MALTTVELPNPIPVEKRSATNHGPYIAVEYTGENAAEIAVYHERIDVDPEKGWDLNADDAGLYVTGMGLPDGYMLRIPAGSWIKISGDGSDVSFGPQVDYEVANIGGA